MLTLIRTDSSNDAFRKLVILLDADLKVKDGDDHAFYSSFNKLDQIGHVVVASFEGTPVGCGAFKHFDSETVEIKRMFVEPEFRGKGIALQVLALLEQWAAELNYKACILETGKKQMDAIRLYQKAGYHVIPNYGQYQGVEYSICMQKTI